MKNAIYTCIAILVLIGALYFLFLYEKKTAIAPIYQKEEITYKNASKEDIKIELPLPGHVVGKEFTVLGQAKGAWFFEADFPIRVLDKEGEEIAVGIAQTKSDWMTEDFVSFKAEVKIPESYTGPATLVLEKDNPSDLRELDGSVSFPIVIGY